MSKHTPGQWYFEEKKEPRYCSITGKQLYVSHDIRLYSGDGFLAAINSDRDGLANAALIAAAPELLEKVKLFYEYAGRICPSRVGELEALISKAEGR